MEQDLNTSDEKNLQSEDDVNKVILFLLCAIGIYNQGITWYALEQQFIRWDFKLAKLSKAEAYTVINELNLIDERQNPEDKLPKMSVNVNGEEYLLKNTQINIRQIRNKVCSIDDIKTELHCLEKNIFDR
jgi:hypothetical protein